MSRHRTTAAVRAGIATDPAHGAVAPSLVLSANFAFAGFRQKRRYDYTRSGNPTRDELAHALASLEGVHPEPMKLAGGIVPSIGGTHAPRPCGRPFRRGLETRAELEWSGDPRRTRVTCAELVVPMSCSPH